MSILDRCESRRGAKVIWLAVHSTESNDRPRVDDAAALRDATWWTGSAHAITDDDPGSLLTPAQGCVPYEMAAWTLRGGNHYSDNIEQVGWARWTRAEWLARPRLLDNTARWLADRHRARPWIPLTKIGPADVKARRPGVIGHVDYTLGTGDGTHTDPGPGYPWDVVIAKARAYAEPQEDDLTPDQWNFVQQALTVSNNALGALLNAVNDPNIGLTKMTADVRGKLLTAYDLSGRPTEGPDDLFGHVMNTEALGRATVKALAAMADRPAGATVPAMPAGDLADLARQIGAQLASDKGFLTALAAAVNEDAARRMAE